MGKRYSIHLKPSFKLRLNKKGKVRNVVERIEKQE